MSKVTEKVGMCALVIVFATYPVMLLWNYCLVPVIPVIPEVTWMQMWGILFLCNILFKSS